MAVRDSSASFARVKHLELHRASNLFEETLNKVGVSLEMLRVGLVGEIGCPHSRFRAFYREDKNGCVIELLHSGRPLNNGSAN